MNFRTLWIASFIMSSLIQISWAQENIPLVSTGIVEQWKSGDNHTLYCKVQSSHTFEISSHNNARLNWILPIGSQVAKGDVIAKQDNFYLDKEIAGLKLEVSEAETEENYAKQENKRLQGVQNQLVSSSKRNDLARQSKQASLRKQQLNLRLTELEYRKTHLTLVSPNNAQIIDVKAQPGEFLADGQSIATLLPIDNKELSCEVPATLYRTKDALTNSSFILQSTHHVIELTRKSRVLHKDSQTLTIYLNVINEDSSSPLLMGERVQVTALLPAKNLAKVPLDALDIVDNQHFVWRINANNTINKIPVKIISNNDTYLVLQSILIANDQVVTFGKQGLKDNQTIATETKEVR